MFMPYSITSLRLIRLRCMGVMCKVGGNLLDRYQLQNIGTAGQQLAVAFFGSQAKHVEIAGKYVKEQLLHRDTPHLLVLHVCFIQLGQSVGRTKIYAAGSKCLDVDLRSHPIQARRIVGNELTGKTMPTLYSRPSFRL